MIGSTHRASLERARQQLRQLVDAEREFLATHPYRLVHEHDMRGGRYLVRVQAARPVPDEIPRLASEVVRDLRTSLDELASALAGAPTKFPIFESLVLFAQRARKAILATTEAERLSEAAVESARCFAVRAGSIFEERREKREE